jgi:hypothetical protein
VLAGEAAYADQQAAPFLQIRQRMASAPQAAEEIDAHHRLVPGEIVHLFEEGVARDARVVDQDIDPAEALRGTGNESTAITFHGDVATDSERLGAAGAALSRDGLELVQIAGRKAQRYPRRSQLPRELGAYAL